MKSFLLSIRLPLFLFSLIAMTACIPPSRKTPAPPSGGPKIERPADEPRGESASEIIIVPKELAGRVVGVHDGDTITVLDKTNRQYKIRLGGIDAPELGQDFGRRSKENLSGLVFAKDVIITYDKVDRWGRIVGKVLIDGQDANLAMVEAGLAWHFKKYEREQTEEDRVTYSNAEQAARESKRGLWLQPNPEPPWDRRAK